MRRLPIVLFTLAVLGLATWSLLRWGTRSAPLSDPWRAMPTNTAVVIELAELPVHWDPLTKTSQLWNAWLKVPQLGAFDSWMSRVVSMVQEQPTLRAAITEAPPLIMLVRSGGTGFSVLGVFAMPADLPDTERAALAASLGIPAADLTKLGERTMEVSVGEGMPAVHLGVHNGLLLLSSTAELVDEARTMADKAPEPLPDALERARNSWGAGADAHLLIHTARAQRILGNWFLPQEMERLSLIEGWVALDLRARPDHVLLSGILAPENNGDLRVGSLHEQGTGPQSVLRVLPASITELSITQVSDPLVYLERMGTGEANDTLRNALFSWVSGSIATGTAYLDDAHRTWCVFQAADPEEAWHDLTAVCPTGTTCDTARYRDVITLHLPQGGLHAAVLGKAYATLGRPYCAFLGDKLVCTERDADLRMAIDAWQDGRTLAEDARTAHFFSMITSASGTTWWSDPGRGRQAVAARLNSDAKARLEAHASSWDEMGGMAVQLTPAQRGDVLVSVMFEHAPVHHPTTSALWNTMLPAPVAHGPWMLKDHTTGAHNILLQDTRDKLVLLASTGKVLWERALEGPVLGGIHQVDRYRNGKLQMVLNTAGNIHMIDRNGKDVEGFPVVLKNGTASPVAVVDYDNERDYRILVTDGAGVLLNYAADGKAVSGWNPAPVGPSANKVEHVRVRGKDHLIAVGKDGKVSALDRRGEVRYTPALVLPMHSRMVAVVHSSEVGDIQLIWTDTLGRALRGRLSGAIDTLCGAGAGQVLVTDMDGDGTWAVVHANGTELTVQKGDRQHLQRSFGGAITVQPVALVENELRVLPVRDVAQNRTHLIGPGGTEIAGSPFSGGGPVVIGDVNLDGSTEVITTAADGSIEAHTLEPISTAAP